MGIMTTIGLPKLYQAADAIALTGLTRNQLREWTSRGRRAIILADVCAEGPGRHALYSWQSLLVLRLLRSLSVDFAVELTAWSAAANDLRTKLGDIPFPALWQLAVLFSSAQTAELVSDEPPPFKHGLFLPLNPHLQVLADKLAIPRPDQLPLFPPMAVSR